jgi:hypothetical protein
MQARDQAINRARAEAIESDGEALASKLTMVATAAAEKHEMIRQFRSERAALRARYRARTELTWEDEGRLFLGALWVAVQRHRPPAEAAEDYRRCRLQAIADQKDLTDFRIVWEAISSALARRDKVLIDADEFDGRLLLFDADFFRTLVPNLLPSSRGMPDRASRKTES